jgi:hypothetical protein
MTLSHKPTLSRIEVKDVSIKELGAGGVAQVVEHLLSKCKSFSSNLSPPPKKGVGYLGPSSLLL